MTDQPRTSSAADAILAEAIATVARTAVPDAALDALLAAATRSGEATRGAIVLWDGEQGRLAVAASIGYDPDEVAAFEAALAAEPDHPVAASAHGQTPTLHNEVAGASGTSGTASWPLRVTNGGIDVPLGALSMSRPGPWAIDASDATTLAALADLVAIVVDRVRLSTAAEERGDWHERMAHTDALTGLANARTLSRVLELEVARAGRQGTELSVALFDVDGLAGLNAAVGPAAGDDALREIAATLSESVRLVDTVARWGGDEFLIVAPGSAGMTVAQRVIEALASRPASKGRAVTVSAGVARFPADGASSDQLVAAAEAALRAAKASGLGEVAAAGAK